MSRGWALYCLFQLLRNSKVLLKEKAVNVLPLPHSEWTVALGGLWLNWDLLSTSWFSLPVIPFASSELR